MNGITVIDLLKIKKPTIIDIRDNYAYNFGHMKKAINIPYYNLLNNSSHFLDKNTIYYLYCETGTKSKELSNKLNLLGYRTYNVIGGYDAYIKLKNI